MSSGAARVRTTSIVCGNTSSATKKRAARAAAHPLAQRHRLGGGRGLVQHRRVGDRHAGQVADHRLEIDQRLEPALRNLGLVRRVRGVPRRVLEDVASDDGGCVRAVVPLTDERLQHPVLRRDRLQPRERSVSVTGPAAASGAARGSTPGRSRPSAPRATGSRAPRASPPDRRALVPMWRAMNASRLLQRGSGPVEARASVVHR